MLFRICLVVAALAHVRAFTTAPSSEDELSGRGFVQNLAKEVFLDGPARRQERRRQRAKGILCVFFRGVASFCADPEEQKAKGFCSTLTEKFDLRAQDKWCYSYQDAGAPSCDDSFIYYEAFLNGQTTTVYAGCKTFGDQCVQDDLTTGVSDPKFIGQICDASCLNPKVEGDCEEITPLCCTWDHERSRGRCADIQWTVNAGAKC